MTFVGTWETTGSENIKEFMLACGSPPENAEKISSIKTVATCKKDGDYYILGATGPKGGTVEHKFILGQEFTESFGPLGKERQSIATLEGNKLTIRGVKPGTVVEIREVNGDQMTWTLTKPGVDLVGKKFYKRV
ncbi:fatty acid-binding protein, liver-like [Glandiceps talaboti]